MDLKFIKSHQCSLGRSYAALTEINPEFSSKPNPFMIKTDSYRSTSHENLQKQNNEDFFIQLLYAWLHIANNNFPPSSAISIQIFVQPISLNPRTGLDFKYHATQEYFRQIYHY